MGAREGVAETPAQRRQTFQIGSAARPGRLRVADAEDQPPFPSARLMHELAEQRDPREPDILLNPQGIEMVNQGTHVLVNELSGHHTGRSIPAEDPYLADGRS